MPTLSVVIPVYNFAAFIPETLDSILAQERADEVEIVVADGASTDGTADLMATRYGGRPNLRYVRFPEKGGIDRDIARGVAASAGAYVWLFGGDDVMLPGALASVLDVLPTGSDVFVGKHYACTFDMDVLFEYSVLRPDEPGTFELADPAQRLDYFSRATNTLALFSFISNLVFRRSAWDRVPLNEAFDGSAYAMAARCFELMRTGLTVTYHPRPLLKCRSGNDSFLTRGAVARYALAIDGYMRLAETFFGASSPEAFHVRRVLRREFNVTNVARAADLCRKAPDRESRAELDRLVAATYSDPSAKARLVKLLYSLPPPVFVPLTAAISRTTKAAADALASVRAAGGRR